MILFVKLLKEDEEESDKITEILDENPFFFL